MAGWSIGVVSLCSTGYHWLVSPPRNPQKCWKPLPGAGHRSNGPAGLNSHTGTSWHLPKWAVE